METTNRGAWNSKLGFVLAAAGSAIGLGNIWRFPTEAAANGGAAFLLIYLLCCLIIGFPVMVAELSIGRGSKKNPVGAFRALSSNKFFPFVGFWGVLTGAMVLSFYSVIAGWTFSHVFVELFKYLGMSGAAALFSDVSNGLINAIFATLFMAVTIAILRGGVSEGIERATKTMMPLLLLILIIMTAFSLFQAGAAEGLRVYLMPDFSKITGGLVLAAMGQAFFSLSLGMGALITYGSYLSKKENLPEVAGYVTIADVGIAFLAGLLVIPTMYVAQAQGVQIFGDEGELLAGTALIFQVLPELFSTIGGLLGLVFGASFFFLLSLAALTSSISLLEVPVSYAIDEHNIPRKTATLGIGGAILVISLIISFYLGLIDTIDFIFSVIGLPLGGLLICVFVAYVWKTDNAIEEMSEGFKGINTSFFTPVWKILIKFVCPALIFVILMMNLWETLQGWFGS
ncbi:MAG: sodium-dependent transporter [Balneolaceae bacterium]